MKIRKYRMDQLEEARRIQKDCIKQHLPCPPVAWWSAIITDIDSNIIEQIESKCNSYTRNGLNMIATHAMYPSKSVISSGFFGDGVISYKTTTSNIWDAKNRWAGMFDNLNPVNIVLGSGNSTESLDSYILGSKITALSGSSTLRSTTFDSATRKLQNSIQKTFINNSGSLITVTESGIEVEIYTVFYDTSATSQMVLAVRDLFDAPISLGDGKSLTFTYNFELLYPE